MTGKSASVWPVVAVLVSLAGCVASSEEVAWDVARSSGSSTEYGRYLQMYPGGAHADVARWEAARRVDTVTAYLEYLKQNPNTDHGDEITERVAVAAKSNLSAADGYAFLAWTKSGTSKKAQALQAEIRLRIEDLDWAQAKESARETPYFLFLMKYPGSRHAQEMQALLQERRYVAVKKLAQPFAYRAFLRFHPESGRVAEIRSLLENSAGASGSVEAAPVMPDDGDVVRDLAAKDPYFRQYGCALLLGAHIRDHQDDTSSVDDLRGKLNGLFGESTAVPAECASQDGLKLDTTDPRNAAQALRLFLRLHEDMTEVALRWKAMQQREDQVNRSAKAAEEVSRGIEADELAEEVLGGGALGGVDLKLSEKGSVTAARAQERLQSLQALAAKNVRTAAALLKIQSDRSVSLQWYLASLLKLGS